MYKINSIVSYLILAIIVMVTSMMMNTGVNAQGYGKIKSGWQKQGRYYYYLDSEGEISLGWKKIDGKWYYFNKKGHRVTGIQVIKGVLYEFDTNGVYKNVVKKNTKTNKASNAESVSHIKKGTKNQVFDKQGNLLGTGKKYISNASAYTGDTTTASGQRPRWGTIAVDPNIIPLGSKVYVPYYDKVFIANDTGGIIKGTMIDIFMKSATNMRNFGRRNIEIYVLDI